MRIRRCSGVCVAAPAAGVAGRTSPGSSRMTARATSGYFAAKRATDELPIVKATNCILAAAPGEVAVLGDHLFAYHLSHESEAAPQLRSLVERLRTEGWTPGRIAHLWPLSVDGLLELVERLPRDLLDDFVLADDDLADLGLFFRLQYPALLAQLGRVARRKAEHQLRRDVAQAGQQGHHAQHAQRPARRNSCGTQLQFRPDSACAE